MLEQNNVNNPSTDDNTNNVTNDGEGETTTDTSKITSTISDYNSEAEEIQSSIENLNVQVIVVMQSTYIGYGNLQLKI